MNLFFLFFIFLLRSSFSSSFFFLFFLFFLFFFLPLLLLLHHDILFFLSFFTAHIPYPTVLLVCPVGKRGTPSRATSAGRKAVSGGPQRSSHPSPHWVTAVTTTGGSQRNLQAPRRSTSFVLRCRVDNAASIAASSSSLKQSCVPPFLFLASFPLSICCLSFSSLLFCG